MSRCQRLAKTNVNATVTECSQMTNKEGKRIFRKKLRAQAEAKITPSNAFVAFEQQIT